MKNNILYYGSRQEPANPVLLTAGVLSASYENGFLRQIKIGEAEVVNMIYYALRDENWGTHHGTIKNEKIKSTSKGFEISYRSVVSAGSIQYVYDCLIKGLSEGKIEFTIQGMSYARFKRNRIGFCILHSIRAYAGKPVKITGKDKSETEGLFPEMSEPFQPFINIKTMKWEPAKGWEAELKFDGDIFEMEDQRNWSDATFKTYCTPLADPLPVEIKMGDTIKQKVVLTVVPIKKGVIKTKPAPDLSVTVGKVTSEQTLPGIGFYDSTVYSGYSLSDINYLKSLSMHHLRVDLNMEEISVKNIDDLKSKSESLGTSLMLALYFGGNPLQEVRNFTAASEGKDLPVDSIIVVDKNLLWTPIVLMGKVTDELRRAFPLALIGGGSDKSFAELNRNIGNIPITDFLVFPSTPQTHLVDNQVMIDNLDGAAGAVKKALTYSGGKPVYISPMSLLYRTSKVTGNNKISFGEQLPEDVDPKQISLFLASWTAGFIKQVSEAGVSNISIYETTGWKGIMQGKNAPSMPSLFWGQPDTVFPVYFVFYWLARLKDATIIQVQSTYPLKLSGLCLQNDNSKYLILANHTDNVLDFPVNNFKKGQIISRLNEKTAGAYFKDANVFLEKSLDIPLEGNLQMMPFEIVVIKS